MNFHAWLFLIAGLAFLVAAVKATHEKICDPWDGTPALEVILWLATILCAVSLFLSTR
jgi:hypothetical protein